MQAFWVGFFYVVGWVAVTTMVAAWSRQDTRFRALAFLAFVLSVPVAAGIFADALGHHRPSAWATLRSQGDVRGTLLGNKAILGEGIYLYLDRPGAPDPVVLPWDTEVAERLQDALRDAGPDGDVEVVIPYEWSWGTQEPPQFNPLPPPKFLPDKPRQEDPPLEYERGA